MTFFQIVKQHFELVLNSIDDCPVRGPFSSARDIRNSGVSASLITD